MSFKNIFIFYFLEKQKFLYKIQQHLKEIWALKRNLLYQILKIVELIFNNIRWVCIVFYFFTRVFIFLFLKIKIRNIFSLDLNKLV